jgi:hypothetical protein
MWGLIAFGLLILFIFVGYQAATKFGNPNRPAANTRDVNGQTDASMPVSPSRSDTVVRTTPDQKTAASDRNPLNLDTTRKLLRSAADQHQYEAAIGYGKQIYDSGNAGPDDLLFIAQGYFSIKDCPNALMWVDRANDAFLAAARVVDDALKRLIARTCHSSRPMPRKASPVRQMSCWVSCISVSATMSMQSPPYSADWKKGK